MDTTLHLYSLLGGAIGGVLFGIIFPRLTVGTFVNLLLGMVGGGFGAIFFTRAAASAALWSSVSSHPVSWVIVGLVAGVAVLLFVLMTTRLIARD